MCSNAGLVGKNFEKQCGRIIRTFMTKSGGPPVEKRTSIVFRYFSDSRDDASDELVDFMGFIDRNLIDRIMFYKNF